MKKIGSFLFIALTSILSAQQLNFEATVDRTTVGLNETFTLEVTASGEDIGNVPRPELPTMTDLDVLSQSQSQSTNISFVNGKLTKQSMINFIYTLRPKKIGKTTIGPCQLKYKDQTYQTQLIDIEVVQGSTQTQPGPGPGPQPGPAPANISAGDLFIEASASRQSVFLGEEVNVEYDLLTRYELANAGLTKTPTFSGFWTEKIFDAERLDDQRKTVNGKVYNVSVIKKVALFPMAAGDLRIDPMTVTVVVVQRDFFDFFGSGRQVPVTSNPLVINARPLPEPKPQDFTGGVGQFSIMATMDRDSSVGSEPIKLTVRVAGRGNIRLIEKPILPSINGLRILAPEVKDGVNITGDAIEGWKEFTFPIIPQTDGEYLVPAITMSFFNTRTAKYETVRTRELRFCAIKTSPSVAVSDASGLKILGTDIRYIKPDARKISGSWTGSPAGLAFIYPLGLLGLALSFWLRRHRVRIATDHSYARRLRSSRLVRKRLTEAETKLKRGKQQDFYCALSQAIIGYTGDRFNIETQAMTKDQFQSELARNDVPVEVIDKLLEILGQCDIARFSPGSMTTKDPHDLLRKTREALSQL